MLGVAVLGSVPAGLTAPGVGVPAPPGTPGVGGASVFCAGAGPAKARAAAMASAICLATMQFLLIEQPPKLECWRCRPRMRSAARTFSPQSPCPRRAPRSRIASFRSSQLS